MQCIFVLYNKAGAKWWIIARPKDSLHFSQTTLFTESYDLGTPNLDEWDTEVVLLCLGSHL